MTDAAIKAAYHTYNRVLGRKVLQIVLEVPLEQEGDVHTKIGYPSPDGSTWVAIARLQEPEKQQGEKPKRSWSELSRAEQAGIACNDPEFCKYLITELGYKRTEPAVAVRYICKVSSRSELDKSPEAAATWDNLYGSYQLWARGAAA